MLRLSSTRVERLIRLGLWILIATALPATVRAQVGPTPFDEQRFKPSPHPNDILGVRTSHVAPPLTYGVALFASYAEDTLGLRLGSVEQRAVDQKATLDVMVSLAAFDWLDVAIDLPVHVYNAGETGLLVDTGGMASAGIGDFRIAPRVRIVDPERAGGFGFALDVELTTPTGAEDAFLREDNVTLFPRLAFDYSVLDGELRFALNVGWKSRLGETRTLRVARPAGAAPLATAVLLEIGEELWFGFGVDAPLWDRNLDLLVDLEAATDPGDFFSDENSRYMEVRGALRYTTDFGLWFLAGSGGGVMDGYGSPQWRVFAGIGFSPRRIFRDADGDGVADDDDLCPSDPEDADAFEDEDGCPDVDDDGDGVKDVADFCPRVPEDRDGFQDDDGCPDPDDDADGILDDADQCDSQAEDKDGYEDEDGCPDPDNDGDGFPDETDACPNAAEDLDGCEDGDGCPDPGRACMKAERIEITDTIRFETGKDILRVESFPLLDEVALLLRAHPEITKIEVAGHTDDRGNARRNLKLSQRRAEAVVVYLVDRGVARGRLVAKGYGELEPIAPNDTEDGRARNRRVEFRILEGVPIATPPGHAGKGAVEAN